MLTILKYNISRSFKFVIWIFHKNDIKTFFATILRNFLFHSMFLSIFQIEQYDDPAIFFKFLFYEWTRIVGNCFNSIINQYGYIYCEKYDMA